MNARIKKIGNETEKKALELLSNKGYWVHLFAYNSNGQPCDIVAIKDNIAMLIDVKHCNEKRFEFRNVQSNQRNCFDYASICGNDKTGFLIYFELSQTWKWLSYNNLKVFECCGFRGVSEQNCEALPL